LLAAFEKLFRGTKYRHRDSSQCDGVAVHLYEDLYELGKSSLLKKRVRSADWVVNIQNQRRGIKARRGDATFGEKVPGEDAILQSGYSVHRGMLATVEIGVEMKILAKAMIKQIDRVMNDLVGQIGHFRRGGGNPICVAIVGINHAANCTSYEGERAFPTDGRKNKHPIQEAASAQARLQDVVPRFDHFLILRFRSTNVEPYPFEWVDAAETAKDYGAILTRISREYDRRFPNGNGNGSNGESTHS
jgi:hypothetical protein